MIKDADESSQVLVRSLFLTLPACSPCMSLPTPLHMLGGSLRACGPCKRSQRGRRGAAGHNLCV